MEAIWEKLALGLYALLFGAGKWYFSKLTNKVEENTSDINGLKTDLALNKQNDEQVGESIEEIQQTLKDINKFLMKYDMVFEKMYKREMES